MKRQITVASAFLCALTGCQQQSNTSNSTAKSEHRAPNDSTTQALPEKPTPILITNASALSAGQVEVSIVAVSSQELRAYLFRKGEPYPALAADLLVQVPGRDTLQLKADPSQAYLATKLDSPLEFPISGQATMTLLSGEIANAPITLSAVGTGPDAVPMSKDIVRLPQLERINYNLTRVGDDLRQEDDDAMATATSELAQDVTAVAADLSDLAPVVPDLEKAADLARQGAEANDPALTGQAQELVRAQREKIADVTSTSSSKED